MKPTQLSETKILKYANKVIKDEAIRIQSNKASKFSSRATVFIRNLRSINNS